MRLSEPEIDFYALEPDALFHDNVINGDPDERWYHSLKLDVTPVAGGVHSMLSSYGIAAHNAHAVGDFGEIRALIARAAHYATDAGTPWHVCSVMGKTHQSGEEALNVHIDQALANTAMQPAKLSHHSIGQSTRDFCQETADLFVAQMRAIQNGAELAKMPVLAQKILTRCAQFTLAIQLELLKRAIGG